MGYHSCCGSLFWLTQPFISKFSPQHTIVIFNILITLFNLGFAFFCFASIWTKVSRFFIREVTANSLVTWHVSKASTNSSTFCVTLFGIMTFLTPWKVEDFKKARYHKEPTLFETQYDWRKIAQVTMKANVIHFWCVESEFTVKN